MLNVSRAWATPLAAGVFIVMAATGLLMFFHVDRGLNKLAHEWLGWLMVAAVIAHATANWPGFKRYLVGNRGAQAVLAVSAVVLVASSLVNSGEAASPPVMALQTLSRAPLKSVLPLAGKSLEQARAELAAVGIELRDGDQTLLQLSQGDRSTLGRAVRVLLESKG